MTRSTVARRIACRLRVGSSYAGLLRYHDESAVAIFDHYHHYPNDNDIPIDTVLDADADILSWEFVSVTWTTLNPSWPNPSCTMEQPFRSIPSPSCVLASYSS